MSLLEQIHTGRKSRPRRTLVYAFGGVGKSTFGASSVQPIFIPTEEGLDDIDCQSFPICKSFDEVIAAIGTLYQESHDFKTVVVDTVDWLERLVWAKVCEARNVGNIEDIGFQKGYTFALPIWQQFVAGLDALRNERGMSVVLLAHAKIERFEDPALGAYDRYTPALHKLASAYLRDWCDEVLFATYQVYTAQQGEGTQKKQVGIGSGERVMRTTERPSHIAKNRLGLPDEMPFAFAEYAAKF